MKKLLKSTLILSVLLVVVLMGVGCSTDPVHNEKATLENLALITISMSREQVKEILGEPFAYDAAKIDWDNHGYDTLIYSPNDMEILDYYKTRNSLSNNLPGLNKHYKFTNKTWERKYYFGSNDADNATAQMTYDLYKIVYKYSKISYIEAVRHDKGLVESTNLYLVTNDVNV